eukprot:GHVL01019938.1.p2 GENE.GHVL01019938.1~~GHVL01019938.1.p2  ORF type:complete len:229 (+),score=76.96 GHVL01019938.1:1674-2360(+)
MIPPSAQPRGYDGQILGDSNSNVVSDGYCSDMRLARNDFESALDDMDFADHHKSLKESKLKQLEDENAKEAKEVITLTEKAQSILDVVRRRVDVTVELVIKHRLHRLHQSSFVEPCSCRFKNVSNNETNDTATEDTLERDKNDGPPQGIGDNEVNDNEMVADENTMVADDNKMLADDNKMLADDNKMLADDNKMNKQPTEKLGCAWIQSLPWAPIKKAQLRNNLINNI